MGRGGTSTTLSLTPCWGAIVQAVSENFTNNFCRKKKRRRHFRRAPFLMWPVLSYYGVTVNTRRSFY
jgi:hypothetical protein